MMSAHTLPELHAKYAWVRDAASVGAHVAATVAASRSGSALAALIARDSHPAWLAKDSVVPLQLALLWLMAFPRVGAALRTQQARAVTGSFAGLYGAHSTMSWAAAGIAQGGSLLFPVLLAAMNGCASRWLVDIVLALCCPAPRSRPRLLFTAPPSRKLLLTASCALFFAALSPLLGELVCAITVVIVFQLDFWLRAVR